VHILFLSTRMIGWIDQCCATARSKASLDSSLKRHTALIKRAKLSIGLENRDQILKDIESLTLEKYVEEIATSLLEGLARCKTDKDVWSATEVSLHAP
jgi:regulator of nonsense transcripts 2